MDTRRMLEGALGGDREALAAVLLVMQRRGDWTLARELYERLEGPEHLSLDLRWRVAYGQALLAEWRREAGTSDAFMSWRLVFWHLSHLVSIGARRDWRVDREPPKGPAGFWQFLREEKPNDVENFTHSLWAAAACRSSVPPEIDLALFTLARPPLVEPFDGFVQAAAASKSESVALRALATTLQPPEIAGLRAALAEIAPRVANIVKRSGR